MTNPMISSPGTGVQHFDSFTQTSLRPWTMIPLVSCGWILTGRTAGISPMAYLDRLRAERAAGLLIETELPIATVGALVGWHDPSHASRRFRATFGLSPSRYRSTFRP